jgi:hypothetical protein
MADQLDAMAGGQGESVADTELQGDKVVKPATITVTWNGILVQHHKEYLGTTVRRRAGQYTPHPAEQPLSLQDHGNPPRFRNIWIRKLKAD